MVHVFILEVFCYPSRFSSLIKGRLDILFYEREVAREHTQGENVWRGAFKRVQVVYDREQTGESEILVFLVQILHKPWIGNEVEIQIDEP